MAFASNGRELASGGEDRTIRLWDAQTFVARGILNGHTDRITSIAFSADGRVLVSGSADQTLRFWNWPPSDRKAFSPTTGGEVRQLAISGAFIVTWPLLEHDGAVRIVNASAITPPIVCSGERSSFLNSIAFNADVHVCSLGVLGARWVDPRIGPGDV